MQPKLDPEHTPWILKISIYIISGLIAIITKIAVLKAENGQVSKWLVASKVLSGIVCGWIFGFVAEAKGVPVNWGYALMPVAVYVGDSALVWIANNWKDIVIRVLKINNNKD